MAKDSKCIICRDNKSRTDSIILKEWIIDGKSDAKLGESLEVHSECLSNSLYVERPEGFVYGRISLGKDEEKSDG